MLSLRTELLCLALPVLVAMVVGCDDTPGVISTLPSSSITPGSAALPPVGAKGSYSYGSPMPVRAASAAPARPLLVSNPPAKRISNDPADWAPAAYERPWRYIVIHHSATEGGSVELFDAAHRARGWDEMGYHFLIDNGVGGPAGQVEVGGRWIKQKWGAHTGKTPNDEYNNFGIGICVVGDYSTKLPSPAQLENLRRLVLFLAQRYNIDPQAVLSHRDAPGSSTDCPGDALYGWVQSHLRPAVAQAARGR